MTVKLSLTAKSLILVSIPLLFGVSFVWALANLQHETEEEAQQAIKERLISQRLTGVQKKLYGLWSTIDAKRHAKQEGEAAVKFFLVYKSTIQPELNGLKQDYVELVELTKDRPELQENAKSGSAALTAANDLIGQAYGQMKTGHFDEVAMGYRAGADQVVNCLSELAKQNFDMVAKLERDSAELRMQRSAARRHFMIGFVFVGCAFNFAFCAILAIFLVRGIIARLAVMSDNARRLAANEPLNQLIGGRDEIEELDKVFHGMAANIEETARMKQELVSMLTHDLRSPLTAIVGSLELLELKANQSEDEREKRLVLVAQRNSSRMMRLINDLLDIRKIKEGMMTISPGEVCLASVYEEVTLSIAGWIDDSAIKLRYEDTELFVYAEREKVERIIFNLVANAIKFSPAGGKITIRTKSNGRMVEIAVADQGGGIPADQLTSIFERFHQVESDDQKQKAGSGLGLTICQYLVNLQGGEIWVESEIGKGSVFYFTLPQA